MMMPSDADYEAARKLKSRIFVMHDRMKGLEGAATCPHRLFGSGQPMAEASAPVRLADLLYGPTPYKHHAFKVTAIESNGRERCECGNYRENEYNIHTMCEESKR